MTYRAYNPVFYVLDHSVPGEHLRERAFTHPEKIIGTVNQQRNYAVAQILNRFIQAEAQLSGDCAEDFELFGGAYAAERCYASVGYRKLAVGDDRVHIHIHNRTKSLAMRAIAFGRIEREGVRGRLGQGLAGLRVHQMARVAAQFAAFDVEQLYASFSEAQGGAHRRAHPRQVPFFGL